MDPRLHFASSLHDPDEVRRVLLASSPSELLLILTSAHILRPDVEHLIRETLIADPRLEPPQLEQLENGSVILPDSRHLLFISDREGEKSQLWLIDTDGGEARKLTNMLNGVSEAAWPHQQWYAGNMVLLMVTRWQSGDPCSREGYAHRRH